MCFLVRIVLLVSTVVSLGYCGGAGVGSLGSAIVDSGKAVLNLVDLVSSQGRMPRGIVIAIVNDSPNMLQNPSEYMRHGVIASIPPEQIPSGNISIIKMEKKESIWVWKGTSGVVVYDILPLDLQLVVLFKVPWNHLADNNAFNVRIRPASGPASKALVNELFKDKGNIVRAKRQLAEEKKSFGANCEVRTQMTNSAKAALVVRFTGCVGYAYPGGTG